MIDWGRSDLPKKPPFYTRQPAKAKFPALKHRAESAKLCRLSKLPTAHCFKVTNTKLLVRTGRLRYNPEQTFDSGRRWRG
jgi:hypothetical protein